LSHRVVIVGGGFGGLYAARALARAPVELTLVDRRNYHLFQPLLYQVATGGLSAAEIASPLRHVLSRNRNTRVWLAEVTDIDVEGRKLILAEPADAGRELAYDTLVLAAGAGNFYFGHDEWKQAAPGLKSIDDATEIRSRILRAFEAAELEADPEKRRAWLTFVLIGGGPTGVELAGALGEIANDTLKHDFRNINPAEAQILLLEGSDRILAAFPAELSHAAEQSLTGMGVQTRTKALATEVDETGVTVRIDGATQRIPSHTVLWAAGVAPSGVGGMLKKRVGVELDRAGRVVVGPDLSVPGHPEILVIGDMACFCSDGGKPLPGVAPVAMQQGRYVAKLIVKRLRGEAVEPFRYWDKGNLATIGRKSAVADFGWIRVSGTFAWLTWLFVHLMYLVGFQNRLVVFVRWTYSYITRNRGARLITTGRN
jgi:NADH dehydrogenase